MNQRITAKTKSAGFQARQALDQVGLSPSADELDDHRLLIRAIHKLQKIADYEPETKLDLLD